MSLVVEVSQVSDGSMYDRYDSSSQDVIDNRAHFLQRVGISLDQSTRMGVGYGRDSYCDYVIVQGSLQGKGMRSSDAVIADALVTTDSGHALFLPVADCVGAVIYDAIHHVLALAHLGRHSLEQHGGQKIIEYLIANYASNPHDLQVWLTPAAGKENYPIWKLNNQGLKEATFQQLAAAGVTADQVIDNAADTTRDARYFSYSTFLQNNTLPDGDHAIVAMMTD